MERRLEFPFEADTRKNDLDRSGHLKEALYMPKADESFVFGYENVEDYNVLLPIPARKLRVEFIASVKS